jgi:hypothetical protein
VHLFWENHSEKSRGKFPGGYSLQMQSVFDAGTAMVRMKTAVALFQRAMRMNNGVDQ